MGWNKGHGPLRYAIVEDKGRERRIMITTMTGRVKMLTTLRPYGETWRVNSDVLVALQFLPKSRFLLLVGLVPDLPSQATED